MFIARDLENALAEALQGRKVAAFLLAALLLCTSAPALEVQARHVAPGTGWMALHGGGSASFWDNYVSSFPKALTGGFTAYGEAAAPAESGHQIAVLVNDCGWAVMLRFDCADAAVARGGTTEFYLSTDPSAAEGRHAPRHIVIHPADPAGEKMVPDYFGAAVPVEARRRPDRTRPYMTEDALSGGYAPTGPVGHEFAIRKGAGDGVWYVSAFFRWPAFGLEIPFFDKNPHGVRWRLKVIRRAVDGSRYVWGDDERPYAGYGFLKWPPFTQGFRTAAYRQWIIAGARKPAGDVTDGEREYWRVSPMETAYGFLAPAEPTFQPREAASDTLFCKALLDPFFASNEKMLSALSYSSEKGAAAFRWPTDEKDRFFSTQIGRVYSVKADIDELRRRYVLDRLLGREVKPPEPKKAKPAAAAPGVSDLDALGDAPPALDLDEEALF